ncbi:LysM peptidoglycan-binding and 3D domain-containing protein [Mesobacillus harenae]|uniref:LysM peptidoglycan-binding and 3D domain-containing protein n=1 Tax=Mesobacillus harenae TaxID=2213203 RepID=UPI001580CDE7|nr:3D domain-containing protein [Mesobacillus harenae]
MKKSLLSLVAATAISGTTVAGAQAEEVTVKKGDTLWGISKQHDVTVGALKKWNGLTSDIIYPNDRLEVSPVEHYKVVKGDTLWGISKNYGVTVSDLQEWNNLNSDIIIPGTHLVVYKDSLVANKIEKLDVETAPLVEAKPAVSSPAPAAEAPVQEEAAQKLSVQATAYTAFCEGCSGTTATGVDLRANPDAKVVAVDPTVIPLGTKLYVEGYGYATAADTGGAIRGNKIDVFIPNQDSALDWGRKQVNVTIIN